MRPYEELRGAIKLEVSFGYTTIRIFRPAELAAGQVGYSITAIGQSLTGEKDGDWLKSWLVIGNEDLCGNPIFIDTSQEEFPVYTAIHGEGRWDAKRIADSLNGLGYTLSAVADVAKGRECPVALENNPLKQSEREAALAVIRQHNPRADLDFWKNLLESQVPPAGSLNSQYWQDRTVQVHTGAGCLIPSRFLKGADFTPRSFLLSSPSPSSAAYRVGLF